MGDHLVVTNGRWFSMYLPGYPALLALFLLIHSEWFLSPLLGSLTVWLWLSYAKRWYGMKVAVVLGLLMLPTSEFFLEPLGIFLVDDVGMACLRWNARSHAHFVPM